MPRSIETTAFIPLDNGGTAIHWRIKLEDRREAAMRQFETPAGLLQVIFPKATEHVLRKVLEGDGFVPGPSDNADVKQR